MVSGCGCLSKSRGGGASTSCFSDLVPCSRVPTLASCFAQQLVVLCAGFDPGAYVLSFGLPIDI